MNRLHFTEYLKNPVTLGDSTIPELKSLVETYPWFQTAQLLYAKALSNANHVDYYSSLKKTSIVAGDRQMLYRLITQVQPAGEEKKEVVLPAAQNHQVTISDTKKTQTQKTVSEESVLPEIKLTSNSCTSGKTTDINFANEEFVSENPAEEKKDIQEDKTKRVELVVKSREELQTPQKDEEKKIETHVSDNKELKVAPIQHSEIKNLDEVIVNPVVNAYIEKEVFHVTDIHKPVKKEEKEEKETEHGFDAETGKQILTATLNEPHSFTEWLKLLSSKSAVSEQAEIQEEEKRGEVKQAAELKVELSKPQEELQKPKLDEVRMKKQEIMDKIIHSNPGPTRITETTQFFNPTKNAKVSNTEDETLVTETLAWIYEQQGNYPKAIKAYKTLSLKYPEKSVYFATLIQKIKLKQKQK